MRISVVIPSYNRRHTLERALQSVFEQTSPVDEVILVDDGSTDDSAVMTAQLFPETKIIRQSNHGVSAARNRGIRAARHDWIALLDSDDSWLPHKIQSIREAALQHPGHVLYHSDEIWMRRCVRVNPMQKHRKSGGWIFKQCLPLCAISPSASVLRKSTLQTLDLFDESLPACEDYDLWLRLCHRFPVYFIEQALIIKYGGHEDQLSRKYPAMDRYRVRALHRLLETESLSAEHFEAARATLRTKLDILWKGARKHGNYQLIDEIEPLRRHWCKNNGQSTC
ncbi:MAG: glycosyltransferase family 2 protein [Gammaproteobacteria bacterium]|nr:glycosyltransferase family 2 protein [Gammaproteobacteria bacterium]